MLILRTVAAGALALGLAAPVMAQKYASGSAGGLSWEARSRIVGMTPTSDVALPDTGGGGDPLFFPRANKSGVVALIMDYGAGGAFICSGSLLSNRMSILTAAHCVSDGFGSAGPLKTTAYFYDGNPNSRTPFGAGVRAIEISKIAVNEGYTGEVIDQNDIAVLRLQTGVFGAQAYDLYDDTDLTGERFNVAGYGGRSTIGGAFGANARTGFLREGDNNYDFRLGDQRFNGQWSAILGGTAKYDFSYVSDFDSGLDLNDMSCRVSQASNFGGRPGFDFCDTGLGAREVGVAGGDSGGPQFIDSKIASVTSYGLTFGTAFGDCRAGLNSSCGEFSGYVPVSIHSNFIQSAMGVPEPQTWAMMLLGFGAIGFATRRTHVTKVSIA